MKSVSRNIKSILIILVLTILVIAPNGTVLAALNGQQLSIYTCNTRSVVIQGSNQRGQFTTYTLTTSQSSCGTYKLSGWWWKGKVSLTPSYNLTQTYSNYAGPTMSVNVPTMQNGDWVNVSIPTPSARQLAMWKAQTWIKDRVPYSQSGSLRDGYRRDCSGYVSFVWGLGSSYNTGGLAGYKYGNGLTFDALQPGDALDNNTGSGAHAVLFVQWVNQSAGVFLADEENSFPGYAQQHQVTINKKTGALSATDGHVYPGTYFMIRRSGW